MLDYIVRPSSYQFLQYDQSVIDREEQYDWDFEIDNTDINFDENSNEDIEGIEHHLNPKTIKQLRKFITFLKANPKIIDNFKNL